jgi:hypothetical protein
MRAVGTSVCSFASDQAATRSIVNSRSLQALMGGVSASAEASMCRRTIRS